MHNTLPETNTPSDIFASMPKNPKELGEWCKKNFGPIIASHIQHLKRFKILDNKKEEGLSFSGAFDGEYTRVQYGKLLIEFPYKIGKLKQSDWIRSFDIIVDSKPVALVTGISSVPDVTEKTSTRSSRLINKLLPPIAHNLPDRVPAANKTIRIEIKKI